MYDGGDAPAPVRRRLAAAADRLDQGQIRQPLRRRRGHAGILASPAAARSRTIWKTSLPSPRSSAEDRLICLALIDAVDEAGYLRADLAEVAAAPGQRARDCRGACWACCRASIRSAWARAIWPNVWRLQLKAKDRLDPAMQALLTRLDLVARRDMAPVDRAVRRRCRRHRRHDRGNPRPQSQAGPGLRLRAGAAGGARRVRARRARRRLAWWN